VKRAKAGETVPRLFELDRLGHEIDNVYSGFDLIYDAHLQQPQQILGVQVRITENLA
jgi:hypothetical protein